MVALPLPLAFLRPRGDPMSLRQLAAVLLCLSCAAQLARAEDGYDLWLRYRPIDDAAALASYRSVATQLVVDSDSPTLSAARAELTRALSGLLGTSIATAGSVTQDGAIVLGTARSSPLIAAL